MVLVHHAEGIHDQAQVRFILDDQAKLVSHVLEEAFVVGHFIAAKPPAHVVLLHYREQGCGQVAAILEPDLWLTVVGVAPALVGMVAYIAGIEIIKECERAIIKGVADDGHVVAVHHAMAEADCLPVRNRSCGAFHHFLEPAGVSIVIRQVDQMREVQRDHMLKQSLYAFRSFVVSGELEVSEANMALSHAHQCRRRLDGFPAHRVFGAHHEQCPGGRDTQSVHGFTAQVFANGGAKHSAAISEAGVGSHTGAFEVPVPASSIGANGFPQ